MPDSPPPPRGVKQGPRRLPPHPHLLNEWRDGATYEDLAKKYGIGRGTNVCETLRRDCIKAGLEWPLPDRIEVWRRKKMKAAEEASVTVLGVRFVIQAYMEEHQITPWMFAKRFGISRSQVYSVLSGKKRRVSPHYAVMIYRKCGEPIPGWMLEQARQQSRGEAKRWPISQPWALDLFRARS